MRTIPTALILGALLIASAFHPALRRIVWVDVIASLGLGVAAILERRDPSSGF